jgi:hypothetical protein
MKTAIAREFRQKVGKGLPRGRVMRMVAAVALISLASALIPAHVDFVQGLSRQDVVQIKKLVRKEIWATAFPDWSWRSFRQLPRRFWIASHTRIRRPTSNPDGTVTVEIRDYRRLYIDGYCDLRKKNGQWEVLYFHPAGPLMDGGDRLRSF